MVALNEITQFLEELFPPEYAEDFDNIGLLIGRRNKEISKVVVCLDCSKHIVREAAKEGAELIITHHPVLFNPIKSITDSDDFGTMLVEALEGGISIYSAHTNLDSVPGGLCDIVAEKMGLVPFANMEGNLGRLCHVSEGITAKTLCEKIKREFNIETLFSTFEADRTIKTVALCNGGGGGSLVNAAKELGADVYISGDLKHHEISALKTNEDIDFIQISHYDSEYPVCALLEKKLTDKFGEKLTVLISKEQSSPLIDTDNIM
jgi:dinuclear metal center YbgI/SA1388 family protein